MIKINEIDNFIFDLDGTLLDNDSKLSSQSISMIDKLHKLNKNIFIATGRSVCLITKLIAPLNIKLPIFSLNGNLTATSNLDRIFIENKMDKKIVLEFFDVMKKENVPSILYTNSNVWLVNPNEMDEVKVLHKKFVDEQNKIKYDYSQIIQVNSYDKVDASEIIKIEIDTMHLQAYALEIINRVAFKNREIINGYFGLVEKFVIQNRNLNKGLAVEKIFSNLKLDLNKTMSFGDAKNDVPLAQIVAFPVAMKNSHKDLKSVSKYETEFSNDKSGVAKFIEKMF
ncbi:hypothetical protein EI74_0584 [Mycoplasma testudineum]|uniref:Cof subfamily protein (Haloacid dehalogenase superfamily)/HAD superfamily hydrolase (TIGR01484 family) n=1 Tax=Mycoplasma testudineum TaxID=244584 RepID=A0A4R6IDQ5_9MOLU|nr:HAD-IIB family hydrolase [Mycoplasma testudineum]OYD26652.1 hypothetical protein CG473_02520 [Mycoplasma testudineum]TDO19781.1 hypothetical protein EI74_0584 [Mycoplasma testudineum]